MQQIHRQGKDALITTTTTTTAAADTGWAEL